MILTRCCTTILALAAAGAVMSIPVVVIAGCLGLLAAPAAAATFTVNTTADEPDADASDPACATAGGFCTLRAAIEQANATAGNHIIAFDLPNDGDGVPTITLGGSLPGIRASLLIDGYTQPGARPNTNPTGGLNTVLKVELDCNDQIACLRVLAPRVTIRGLVVNNGDRTFDGCVRVEGLVSVVVDVAIEGNFFGTDPTGTTKRGCRTGVHVANDRDNSNVVVTVGGTTPAARTLISGCGNDFIGGGGILASSFASGVSLTVQGNLIGTDRTGMEAIPNFGGIVQSGLGAHFTDRIGGETPEAANVISGNSGAGIELDDGLGDSIDAVIQGNLIGTDVTRSGALGNGSMGGVYITGDGSATVEDNVIAFNAGPGVALYSHAAVRITANSIHSNGQLGIDLQGMGFVGVVEANDDKDADTGPNDLQNFPLLDTPVFPGGTSVMGTLNSTPGRTFRIEVFTNDECDPARNGEGQTLVGTVDTAPTDASGDVSFTVAFGQSLAAGTLRTATATDLMTGATSEFSSCPLPPTATTTTSTTTSTSTTTTVHTTTLPADPCAVELAGPTFRSLDCRLAAMLEEVRAAVAVGRLGPFGTKLPKQVAKAKGRTEQAEAACREPKLRRAKGRLAKDIREMIQIGQTLNSRQARRSIDRAVREALHAAALGIRTDMRTLRGALRCPEDTPGV